jgi:Glycine/sarcosine/betaine reductase component B subunits
VNFETVRPGESCRAGPIFDIVQPRAKETGSSPDFPGILGPPMTAGVGITHVLEGAAVSVLAERSPGESRSVTGRVLEMSGVAGEATVYSSIQHLVVSSHTRAGLPIHIIDKAYCKAALKVAVYLGRGALDQTPESTQTFEPVGPGEAGREGLLCRADLYDLRGEDTKSAMAVMTRGMSKKIRIVLCLSTPCVRWRRVASSASSMTNFFRLRVGRTRFRIRAVSAGRWPKRQSGKVLMRSSLRRREERVLAAALRLQPN